MDSDGSPFRVDSYGPLVRGDDNITWMPPGDMERLGRIAYAYINLDGPSDNPAPFICAALFSVAPRVHFTVHASSSGNMMMRFGSCGDRDVVTSLSPITHDGALLTWSARRRRPTASTSSRNGSWRSRLSTSWRSIGT